MARKYVFCAEQNYARPSLVDRDETMQGRTLLNNDDDEKCRGKIKKR